VQERKAPKLRDLLRLLFDEYAPSTREMLGEERVAWLRGLPAEYREDELALVHASPGDLWRAPQPDAEDGELNSTYGVYNARLVVYGHIHRPYVRRLNGLVVANSGSVGSPFDGDPRASYLLVSAAGVEVVRVEYDVDREASALLHSNYPGAARIAEMLRHGRFVPVAS
jgi:diadenosine tetraphosphatase ApaH/serine/threonine PP2A family protein phosphatase